MELQRATQYCMAFADVGLNPTGDSDDSNPKHRLARLEWQGPDDLVLRLPGLLLQPGLADDRTAV